MLDNKSKIISMALLLLITAALYSHGDLPIRIEGKTQEISKDSTNSKLYFDRGFLYQQHFEFNRAKCDYLKSKELGNTNKLLSYRIAEVNYNLTDYATALEFVNQYIKRDSLDVKPYKLKAQILIKLNKQSEALEFYDFVIKNTHDIRPEDIVEYSTIFLLIDSTNYAGSIHAIDIGLNKLGNDIISLRLAKIDYLKRSNQAERVIEQYNDLIRENTRKEFWYFRKANYLFDIDRLSESDTALQMAKISIEKLKPKIKNTSAIKNLINQINTMEKSINHEV